MNLVVDVQYGNGAAAVAGILFEEWNSERPFEVVNAVESVFGEYEPGAFYKRELPCIQALLARIPRVFSTIVIDGYVTLGGEDRPGLGMHLHEAIGGGSAVIGLAKTRFHGIPPEHEVLRGDSQKPLFVTAVGCSLEVAKSRILAMSGPHRIPFLIKRADAEARELAKSL